MLQKFSFLFILAILLTGCGAEAPTNEAGEGVPSASGIFESTTIDAKPGTPTALVGEENREPQYFQFITGTTTTQNESGVPILLERYCYGTFHSPDAQQENWVNGILTNIESDFNEGSRNLVDYANNYLIQNGTAEFYSYSNYQKLNILRQDTAVVSLVSDSSLYSGGPHGSAVLTAYNLDISNCRLLTLEDILYGDNTQWLEAGVLAKIESQFSALGEGALYDTYPEQVRTACTYGSMTPYWYLDSEGLTIYFNQYELAPYAAGTIRATFSYEELDGILREEYLPQVQGYGSGDLVLRHQGDDFHSINITANSGTDTLAVGVSGEIYQVQVSQVQWLDKNPISRDLLFSATALEQQDVLQITGNFHLDSERICIEFTTGDGTHKSYCLTSKGIIQTP